MTPQLRIEISQPHFVDHIKFLDPSGFCPSPSISETEYHNNSKAEHSQATPSVRVILSLQLIRRVVESPNDIHDPGEDEVEIMFKISTLINYF